jgi:hypothetical protein
MPPMTAEKRYAYKATTWGRARVLISNAKQRCREKNVEISISAEWVEEHLKRGTCELTGLPFDFGPPTEGLTRLSNAPSLDRINKDKPYTEDNTRVILWAVNCALAEYGTEIMLPILKAMVKGIEDAQEKSITSVSRTDHRESEIYPELGSFSATWAGEDSDNAHHHCGADARKDLDSSTQASSRNSVGCGSSKMGTSFPLESEQDNWHLHPTYGWIER